MAAPGRRLRTYLTLVCSAAIVVHAARPPTADDTCPTAIQTALRYNISARTHPEGFLPVQQDETLAEAVCCDRRTAGLAEPKGLFAEPGIALFDTLKRRGGGSTATTFYDSACGVPVFRAPVNRSFLDFMADTMEHGWPSFRKEEVVHEHVKVGTSTNYVTSSCGTHLGTYLPDARGPRWCIDLSCIAGTPTKIGG